MQLYNPQYQYPQTGMAGTSSQQSSNGPLLLLLAAGAIAAFIWWTTKPATPSKPSKGKTLDEELESFMDQQRASSPWADVPKFWEQRYEKVRNAGIQIGTLPSDYDVNSLDEDDKRWMRKESNRALAALPTMRKMKKEATEQGWKGAADEIAADIEYMEEGLRWYKEAGIG